MGAISGLLHKAALTAVDAFLTGVATKKAQEYSLAMLEKQKELVMSMPENPRPIQQAHQVAVKQPKTVITIETPSAVESADDREWESAPNPYLGTSQLSSAGRACIPCGNDHFSAASSYLSEAIRFARSEGFIVDGEVHPEVLYRINAAMDELNAFERIDGAADKIAALPQQEKAVMDQMLIDSRNMRQLISNIDSAESLEQVAADARKIRMDAGAKLMQLKIGNRKQL